VLFTLAHILDRISKPYFIVSWAGRMKTEQLNIIYDLYSSFSINISYEWVTVTNATQFHFSFLASNFSFFFTFYTFCNFLLIHIPFTFISISLVYLYTWKHSKIYIFTYSHTITSHLLFLSISIK